LDAALSWARGDLAFAVGNLPGEAYVKIVVDLAVCQGYAQCAFLAPDAFRIYGEEALLYDPRPDDELRERVVRAAVACPVQAIAVEREQW
jgi:ferredoxin